MTTTKHAQLRITVWPGGRIEEPPVAAVEKAELVAGEWISVDLLTSDQVSPVPDDLYLYEIADADPSDPESLRRLANLGLWRSLNIADAYGDLPIWTDEQWRRALADVALKYGRPVPDDLEKGRHEVWDPLGGVGFPIHLEEIALRVRAVQRLSHHAQLYATGEDVAQAWRPDRVDSAVRARLSMPGLTDEDSPAVREVVAWEEFTRLANAALREFHVRVYADVGRPGYGIGSAYPTVYQVAVLQIVNDMAGGGSTYHTCGNETCGRPFLRQRGRSRYYSRAEGVRYCSRECANAQTQRDYRRRKRAERNERR